MTNQEWIELFFSESFEKQINDLILEDWDYEIPRDSILNYVRRLLEIPYKEFLDFVEPVPFIDDYDLPQLSLTDHEIRAIIALFLLEDNRGLKSDEVGCYINLKYQKNYIDTAGYGSRLLGTMQTLGLVYEYYDSWYLNCVAYILNQFPKDSFRSIISRLLIRDRGVSSIVLYSKRHILPSIYSLFINTSDYWISRYVSGVCSLVAFCREECGKEGIYISYLLEDPYRKTLIKTEKRNKAKLGINVERYFDFFDGLSDNDLYDRDLNYILSMNGFVKAVLRDITELEVVRDETNESCPEPSLREGERLNKLLVVAYEGTNAFYVPYDFSWRGNEMPNSDSCYDWTTHRVVSHRNKRNEIPEAEQISTCETNKNELVHEDIDSQKLIKQEPDQSSNEDKPHVEQATCHSRKVCLCIEHRGSKSIIKKENGSILYITYNPIVKFDDELYTISNDTHMMRISKMDKIGQLYSAGIPFIEVDGTTDLYAYLKHMKSKDVRINNIDFVKNTIQFSSVVFNFDGSLFGLERKLAEVKQKNIDRRPILPEIMQKKTKLEIARTVLSKQPSNTFRQLKKAEFGFIVSNESNRCYILDSQGQAVYSGLGKIITVGGSLFKMYTTYSALNIYTVDVDEQRVIKANHRVVNVRHNTPLYKTCSNFSISSISGSSNIKRIDVKKSLIKVGNNVYSFDGKLITKEDIGQADLDLVTRDNTSLTDYPFVSGNISCSVDKSKNCFIIKKTYMSNYPIGVASFKSDLGVLLQTQKILQIDSYLSRKGNRIEVTCLFDGMERIMVFNSDGKLVWDKKKN